MVSWLLCSFVTCILMLLFYLIFLEDKFSSLVFFIYTWFFLMPLDGCENTYTQIHCDLNNLSKSHLNGTLFFVACTNTFHCNYNMITQPNSNKRLLLLLNPYLQWDWEFGTNLLLLLGPRLIFGWCFTIYLILKLV
jgi:hypothetical protein